MRQLLFFLLSCRYFHRREVGQGLVEYGMILVLIAVVCVGILSITGNTVSEMWYQRVVDALDEIL